MLGRDRRGRRAAVSSGSHPSTPGQLKRLVIVVLLGFGAISLMGPATASDYELLGLEATGRGPFDQYRQVVQCHAVLNMASSSRPGDELAAHLEQGVYYAARFARFLLEADTILDPDGTLRQPRALPGDLAAAGERWRATLKKSAVPALTQDDATDYCLELYGHEWE